MTKTEEPLAAILAEMRYRADNHRQDGWESVGEELDDLADRIEAAAERERNAHTNDIHNALYMAAGTPGDAAAMRAALVEVEGAIFEDEPGRFWLADAEVILHRVKTALSAPARNCDRFRTLDDFSMADSPIDTPLTNATREQLYKVIRWLFATAEGGDHA